MRFSSADEAARIFLRDLVVPRRLREPRICDELARSGTIRVPTRWGDVASWRLGPGPAVLLVHGFEDDNSLWSPLVTELANRGRSLVAFDLPGHGASSGDWGMSFEGTDAIVAVADALGPVDAVVAHSAGCGMATAAIGEGWGVSSAAFVAPPLGVGNRWLRKAAAVGVDADVALRARTLYFEEVGVTRGDWQPRPAYQALAIDLLVVHSRDDEHFPATDTEEVMRSHSRAELVLVDGLSHRRTARDPGVVSRIADFVTR